MKIGIVGGTGNLGTGLALRWARAGHTVLVGSRDGARARACVAELAPRLAALRAPSPDFAGDLSGGDNAWAAREAEVVVVTVPYEAHAETLRTIREAAANKVVIDTTVPLKPPKVSRVQLPAGQAAALESQALLGDATPVASALHHVSAVHLADPAHAVECDVLVASDDARAKGVAMQLVADLGLRALDAGPLVNAIALESLTPVLIHLNRTYKSQGAGIVLSNLPAARPST
jgi:NADPH-dependent F420 reductase